MHCGNFFYVNSFLGLIFIYICGVNEELTYILTKVGELYRKYGIKSVTMDDVSHELGISKKTLYQYFTDKDDLVGKFIDNEIASRHKDFCICFREGFNAIEELFEIAIFMNRFISQQNPATEHDLKKYYPHHYQKSLKARREGIYNYILQNLKKGKEEGLYRPELNEEIIAKIYLSRVESIHLNDLLPAAEFTSAKLFIEYIVYHVRGIGTEEGIRVLENRIKEFELTNKNN
jgi:TetR/AcrR family transcriptional regulator, cholesterol catabolism regulator